MEEYSIYIVVANVIICFATVIGNVLILAAVVTTPRLHTPSNVLLCNLAAADLGVGLFTLPIFLSAQLCEKSFVLTTSLNLSVLVFAGVSMAGMTLISLDRYLALWLHLRYRSIVTLSRTVKLLVVLWTQAGIIIMIYFLRLQLIWPIGSTGALLCFVISSLVYIRIYLIVRRHKKQIQVQNLWMRSAVQSGPIPRHGKSIKTMYLVNGFFVVSWVPLVLLVIMKRRLHSAIGEEGYTYMRQAAITFFLSNSFANPILYCWRVNEIRQAVIKISRKINKKLKRNQDISSTPPVVDVQVNSRQ